MSPFAQIALNVTIAWAAGSVVGLERSYNGRVAGFRTHGLVALAAAATMAIAYAPQFVPGGWPDQHGWLEPTRLAQGVMSGVGFLGAGVIFKEGVSIQGLTTAASIWATAAIGLVLGLGMIGPGLLTTAAVLLSLTVLSKIEALLPSRIYALATFRFHAEQAPDEAGLLELLGGHAVTLEDMTYRLSDEGRLFEFQGAISTSRRTGFESLAHRLKNTAGLLEFELLRVSK